ncbi:ABC transporter permease [Clostridium sp. MB05]|uniref:ABC transporter permease n=2 Tax=Clostridium TaxID=1485 RepID=UPI003982798D
MNNKRLVFYKETFNLSVILGFTISLISFLFALTIFKSNFDFYNDSKLYSHAKTSININLKSEIDSNVFYNKLNNADVKYLTQDAIYDRSIKNINYVKGIHDTSTSNIFPLHSGRFLSEEEINSESKVVVVGKNLLNFTYKVDNKTFIDIFDEAYEVKGIVGRETASKYSIYILMPPKVYSKLFNNEPSNNYTIDVDKENVQDVVNTINNSFSDEILNVDVNSGEQNESPIVNAFEFEKAILTNLIVAIIFSILCSVTFTLLWFEKINKNISIRKALGANKKDIFLFIFKNLIKMFIISVILSLIAFYGLVDIFKHLTIFDMIINIESCLYSIITLFVFIIILSLVSLRKFSKIEITNLLRS